jgi:alkanesulfonate monooxygenase SsuD/methylene tetrahydromethanopterin reductase-like flavin-dependent oxidoreductase (luciferase family)
MVFATLTKQQQSSDAAERIINYLCGAYGMDPEHATAVAVGGSPHQVAEQLAAYEAAGASTLVIVPFGQDMFTQYDLIVETRSMLSSK